MKKRILSILLLCCMVLTLLPTTAFAAGKIWVGTEEELLAALADNTIDKITFCLYFSNFTSQPTMESLCISTSAIPYASPFRAVFLLALLLDNLLHILKKVSRQRTHLVKIFALRHIHYDDNSI